MDFKKLAEERKAKLIGNATTFDEYLTLKSVEISNSWNERQNAQGSIDIERAYKLFSNLMRTWRNDLINVDKHFNKTSSVQLLECLALGFSTFDFKDDEYEDFKKLCIKTAGYNSYNGKQYQSGQFKSFYDYTTFREFIVDNFDSLTLLNPELMEILK